MAGIRVHRSEAARYTRMAQGASAVLLAGAVGAFALLPVAGRMETPGVQGDGKAVEEPTATGPGIDFAETAERLSLLGDVKKDPPPAEEGQENPDQPTGPQTPTGPDWKYLGAIVEPDRLIAIIESGGGQHLVSAGASLDGIDVVEVRGDAIVVAEGAGRRTIELQKRTGAVLGGGVSALGIDLSDDGEHDAETKAGMMDPRAIDRRGPAGTKRPTGPGTKNMPRTPRPNPPGPTRQRQAQPEGS